MAEGTKIEWTTHTANFWWGCVKTSTGCQNCYALSWANRWGKQIWGPSSTTDRSLALLGILILCATMVGVGFLLGWLFAR